ncbi:MAG: SpoIIE family protein phosphatase [Calditrichaeota bacterium]|nr:SpoIIE family protein phosphatase [Calditrichota bacterium]MCB9365660.1 SpoIIE family protein phosphatase [Calditrichota bacterium]MCB9391947.1 SpoIIE family protein phosphatase [Calditrichota bacterium]
MDIFAQSQDSAVSSPGKFVAFARVVAGGAGLLLLLVLAALMLQEQSAFKTYLSAGVYQSNFKTVQSDNGDTLHLFQSVSAVDFPDGILPQVGDTILSVNGLPANEAWPSLMQDVLSPGTGYPLEIGSATGVRTVTIVTALESRANLFMLGLIDLLRFMIGLGFIGVGLWAFFAQPNSTPVRVFAWFCYAMTGSMIAGVNVMPDYYATFEIPLLEQFRQFLGVFAIGLPVFWLHLQLIFPRTLEFVRRNRRWLFPVIYSPLLFVAVAAIVAAYSENFIAVAETTAQFCLVPLGLWLLIGFVILGRRFRKTPDRVEKRQLRLILWGTAIGLGGFLALVLILNIFSDWFRQNQMRSLGAIVVGFLMLLSTPIAYAYAFSKYRLLEVQGKIKRGTRYLVTSAVAFTLLAGIVYVFVRFVLKDVGTTVGPILLVLLAFGVGRVSSRLTKTLEKRFYPERQVLRSRLETAIEKSSSFGSFQAFLDRFAEQVQDSLHVESVQPVLAGEDGNGFRLRDRDLTPFMLQGNLLTLITRERRPVFVDELMASGRTAVSDEEHEWLSGNRVALVLPLMSQQRLTGFLALGYKTDREDYAPEELSILSTLAPQVAMAGENLRLLEENVEKRRLEEQMQMARRIQEGFLPRELPQTMGLDIATHNRFSLEVAGDYFDVMPLPDGQTIVAIADVSGKGAGAALLMANLQASLRTAVELGIPLTQTIAQVNNLIFRNTPPEQYITFVAVRFDPKNQELCFVNAGHNPPLLIRTNGTVEELPPTGLILGAIPNVPYENKHVQFMSGDMLVFFTDGVSEAMNAAEEEYGEGRIQELCVRLRHETPQAIVTEIERDVERFCGRVPMEDDSTMVIVKRL